MAQELRIKQITLPGGSTYNIYDEKTRKMVTARVYTAGVPYMVGDLVEYEDELYRINEEITASGNTDWSEVKKQKTTIDAEFKSMRDSVTAVVDYIGVTTSALTDGSTLSPIVINGEDVTPKSGNLVISGSGASQKEYIWSGTTWNEFGSTGALKALAFKDNASGSYDKATSGTVTVPTISSTSKYLSASASGAAVQIDTTTAAVTGYSSTSNDTFVKSYPGVTSKLATTSVRSAGADVTVSTVSATNTVFGADTTASKATAGTAFNVAKKKASQTSVASGALGAETSTRTDNSPMWGAQVSSEVLSFTFKPISTTDIQEADSTEQSITPYSFADVTVPVVSSNNSVSASSLGSATAVAAAGSDVTVATGALNASDSTGASIMTGLGEATTASALTALGDPTTENVAKTISVSTQPTITISKAATGDVEMVETISTGTETANITLGHTATSITVS